VLYPPRRAKNRLPSDKQRQNLESPSRGVNVATPTSTEAGAEGLVTPLRGDTVGVMGMPSPSAPRDRDPSPGQHLATISHQGRFWDIFVEVEDSGPEDLCRASLAYLPADRGEAEFTLRTIPLILESSRDEVLRRAYQLETHQLIGFLRSLLP
jgi:hypothetical protein